MSAPLLLGAVAYDPKVVTIWAGFRSWLRRRDVDLDFVLYSQYERQVEDLLAGRIDVAWNSPLAWVRARRLAVAGGGQVRAVAMRDTDRDLTSVVVVRSDASFESPADLRGGVVAAGAVDSPQATLLPLSVLRHAGLEPDADLRIRFSGAGVGLHGDHAGGEREGAQALRDGAVDAACMARASLTLFGQEGILPAGSVRVLGQTEPFDHCNMTAGPGADQRAVDAFASLLLRMSYQDAEARPLLDLEGLRQWLPGRASGYDRLEEAVDENGFYDQLGKVSASNYRP
jgi:ABC-type phosphate/phosphonate transport system substrate-binding protein